MQLFYDPDLSYGLHVLREEEVRHLRVLRKEVGEELQMVDGRGGWYTAAIVELSKRRCLIDVRPERREEQRAAHHSTLLLAPTKSTDRTEWVLEKCTEIGIDRIVPILTDHAERRRLRTDRLARVLESAMKQSLTAWLPELTELTPLADALILSPETDGYLAYLGGEGESPLLHRTATAGRNVTVAVGPEGGFSPAEAALARERGFDWVSLGPKRLRTETAAICAVHTLEMTNWNA